MLTRERTAIDDDSGLLSAVARGDENAFRTLYDRFSGPLYSLLFRILQNQEDAEEVLQTTFLQVWKKAATYQGERCSVFTWLVLMTRSRGIDRLRQRQRQNRTLESATQEAGTDEQWENTTGDAVLSQENQMAVRGALEQLPAEQRQAIEMAFFDGMSHPEISDALAAPLGTIKARIRRGMLRLRDQLARRI